MPHSNLNTAHPTVPTCCNPSAMACHVLLHGHQTSAPRGPASRQKRLAPLAAAFSTFCRPPQKKNFSRTNGNSRNTPPKGVGLFYWNFPTRKSGRRFVGLTLTCELATFWLKHLRCKRSRTKRSASKETLAEVGSFQHQGSAQEGLGQIERGPVHCHCWSHPCLTLLS